ncbi:MAG TPA: tetratricopeptide repeat protein [Verrucomicrobiae bacterium]|jgi:tetratricopeptide (TPR) repeat protein
MMTTKKRGQNVAALFVVGVTAAFLTACGPPGSRDLHRGEKALQSGDYDSAITKFSDAVRTLSSAPPSVQSKALGFLGLAYQQAGQLEPASQAYLRALKLDHNNEAVDYNLGCLRLAQSNYPGAIDYFTTCLSLNPRGVNGYLKLGTVRYRIALEKIGAERARQLESARREFEAAEKIAPTAEGANSIGMLELQRRNGGAEAVRTAAADFQTAIERDAHYGPALLNLAILNQQNLGQPKKALQLYLQYLALQPPPPHAKEVAKVAQQLNLDTRITIGADAGGTPEPAHRVTTPANNSTPAPVKATPAEPHSAKVVKPAPEPDPGSEPQIVAVPAQTPAPPPTPPPKTIQPTPEPVPTPAQEPAPPPASLSPAEITSPAQPVVSNPAAPTNQISAPQTVAPASSQPEHKSFGQKLNPLHWFSGKSQKSAPTPAVGKIERYKYPQRITSIPGNRPEAERLFGLGAAARQQGNLTEALTDFRQATEVDSSYFDASLSLSLTAVDAGDYDTALKSLFRTLTLRENSADARYAFAWVLEKRGYYIDAANELDKLLSAHPKEVRGHLLLGNLDAEKLGKTKQAKQHYAKVLELDPDNSQASAIRAWILKTP